MDMSKLKVALKVNSSKPIKAKHFIEELESLTKKYNVKSKAINFNAQTACERKGEEVECSLNEINIDMKFIV